MHSVIRRSLLCLSVLLQLLSITETQKKYIIECMHENENSTFSFTPGSDFLPSGCPPTTTEIRIESNGTDGYFDVRDFTDEELDFIFQIKHFNTCIRVLNTHLTRLHLLMDQLSGDCQGPLLDVIGNHWLMKIKIGKFIDTIGEDAIRIRGNLHLKDSQLSLFKGHGDIQVPRECANYKDITRGISMEDIEICTDVYGILTVDSEVENVEGWKLFTLTGCIQVDSTQITNVDFMENFKQFTPLPMCKSYLRNNSQLCVKHRHMLYEKFPGIEIYDNKLDCEHQCEGGSISWEYLNMTSDCEVRIGDVVIKDLKGKPSNIGVLRKTKFIEGRLVIENNQGLGDFNAFESLEGVGKPKVGGSEPAMEVVKNGDLTALRMPNLKWVSQDDTTVRIRIMNNAELRLSDEEVEKIEKAAGGSSHVQIIITESEHFEWLKTTVIAVVLVIAFLKLLVVIIMFIRHKARSSSKLPRAPCKLSKKSKAVLNEMSKEILSKNPMVWCVQDRPLLWRYAEDDPDREETKKLKARHSVFLENYQAKLIPYASLPKNSKQLLLRIKRLILYPVVVAVATVDNIQEIVPRLPHEIGSGHTYDGEDWKVTFRLRDLLYIGDRTLGYVYDVAVIETKDGKVKKAGKKVWRVVLYVWEPLRLPLEFAELLQVLRLFTEKNSICVSVRRKEVFSLLHLVYTYVYVLQQAIGVEEAFRLHTDNCNGAPLDWYEMLYVMAFILEWAYQSYSISQELEQKHVKWCHTYARMAAFSKEHPNIMVIRPEHLQTDRQSELKEELEGAGAPPGARFTERPITAMKDNFRLRTRAEREKNLRAQQASVEKDTTDKDDDEKQNTGKENTMSVSLGNRKYRASPDDPARKLEEERIAKALKKRESLSKIPTDRQLTSQSRAPTDRFFSKNVLQQTQSLT